MKVLDYSTIYRIGSPDIFTSMTLDIACTAIPNGRIDSPLDVLAYLTSARVDDELYIITPDELGLSEETYIPDGLYTFTYAINDIYTKEVKFASILEIEEAYAALLLEVNYEIDVTTNEVRYAYDTADSKIEEIRIIAALIEQLELEAVTNDAAKVADIIDKLQRLLQLA